MSYSRAAFISRMRISRSTSLFIVVEGREIDTPFYEQLAKSSLKVRDRGYQVWLIEQITRDVAPGKRSPGGKRAVLDLYDYCRKRKCLSVSNSSGRRSISFCVDRDNDHVSKSLRRSPHVTYTQTYDAAAHAFVYGRHEAAIALAAYLDEDSAKAFLQSHPRWMDDLSVLWQKWIELCSLAQAHSSWCHVGFSKKSLVNKNHYGPLDAAEVARAQDVIARKSRVPADLRGRKNSIVLARLRRIYAQSDALGLIPAEWFSAYLLHLVSTYFHGAPVALAKFEERAITAFLGTLDYSDKWADYYRERFEMLL